MLYIHTSNQLEHLAVYFSRITNTPLSNVFAKETVIVQNAGMARWLSMQHADITGISANIEFLFPAEFMWKLLRIVSPDVSEQSQCTPETLSYHIMEELTLHHEDYPELKHYIYHKNKNVNDIATWDLSCQLGDIFDQYLFFRSEWIQQWEENPEKHIKEDWQARLWIRCVKEKQLVHWQTLQDQFKESIHLINKSDFPKRVTFFSMPALSPGYLDLLGEVAQLTNIYMYMINPCEDIYWGNILSEKTQTKLSSDEQTYAETGNPLLASMGKQGRDFIHQLLDTSNSQHLSVTPELQDTQQQKAEYLPVKNILQQLQIDIYNLQEPEKIENYNSLNNNTLKDNSIRFNACHTAMREVEVLHDQILDALDADNTLTPADIVVMLPDIENYAPYIESIFSSINSSVKLPYSIADRASINAQQLVEAVLKVLKLVDTRFDVESVFEILDYEEVRTQFELDEANTKKCRKLALATNTRWGIDRHYRKKNNLPDTQEHTWKYALDGLLLGYAFGESTSGDQLFSTNNDSDLPLFSHNIIEGNDALILASFKQFTDVLFAISDWHNSSASVDSWLTKTKVLISQLFPESSDITILLKALNGVKQTTELTEFSEEISFSVFFKILQSTLLNISGSERFLGHGITFCAMVPMRSIPFRLIALMGMNDGEFPRQNKRYSFDRLGDKPRRGDRSRRDEDRYLFLESILAARSRLIISYIGQSVKDNTEIPPSILVSELLDTLSIYSDSPMKEWITRHPLQAFSPRYFNESLNSLNNNIDSDSDSDNDDSNDTPPLFSYAKEYTELNKTIEIPSQIFIDKRLEELEDDYKKISINELIRFYQSPARAFLKTRFAIQTYDEDISLPIREPFELEFFKDKEIRKIILAQSESERDQMTLTRAKGLLPYGEIGEGVFKKEAQIIENFKGQLPEVIYLDNLSFSLSFDAFQLSGELAYLSETGRIIQQVSKPYFPDYINLWIHHLILNTVVSDNINHYTTFYSPDSSFTFSPVKDAQEQLSQLLVHYWEGLHFPSKFFPKSGLSLYAKGGAEANTKQAITTWHGSTQLAGEKTKFEHWLLYRTTEMNEQNIPQEFLEISQLFFGSLFLHLEEIE